MKNQKMHIKSAIKKNIQNKVELMNHQVQLDLEKVFNNAIENVDEYEDKDLSGKQIKRNTSAIADKINYLLDELPDNHPLRKSNSIQKLVDKLEDISQKPDAEVTYDVMVAGGKPPKVSKQRFWSPITNLLNQARADVIKPSAYTEDQPQVGPQAQHLDVRQGQIVKNKPVPSIAIPKKAPKQVSRGRINHESAGALPKREEPKQILHESGAEPGYVFDITRSYARDSYDKMKRLNDLSNKTINAVSGFSSIGHSIRPTIQKDTLEIHKIMDEVKNETLDTDAGYAESYFKDKSSQITAYYGTVIDIVDKMEPFASAINDVIERYSNMKSGETEYNWIIKLQDLLDSYEQVFEDYHNEVSSIENIISAGKTLKFAADIDKFFDLFNKTDFVDLKNKFESMNENSERYMIAYSQLITMDKDKQVYNDFMKVLKDGTSTQDIKNSINQYVQNRVNF